MKTAILIGLIGTIVYVPIHSNADTGKDSFATGIATAGLVTTVLIAYDEKEADNWRKDKWTTTEKCIMGISAGMFLGSWHYFQSKRDGKETSYQQIRDGALLTFEKESRKWSFPPLLYQGNRWHIPLISLHIERMHSNR